MGPFATNNCATEKELLASTGYYVLGGRERDHAKTHILILHALVGTLYVQYTTFYINTRGSETFGEGVF